MSTNWTPTNDQDRRGKEAFEGLNSSIDKVVKQAAGGGPNTFVLNPQAFSELQAYVLTGRDLPRSDGDFERRMPRSTFQQQSDVDSSNYDSIRSTAVHVRSSCDDFFNNFIPRLVTVGQVVIQYSDSALEMLEVAEDINLRHNLDIMLQPKYAKESDLDGAYRDAREAAQMTLDMLNEQARDKEKEINSIFQPLNSFKETTRQNASAVESLKKQYATDKAQQSELSNIVSQMVQQHNDIDNKMANVVNALSELKSLFADHASCYDKIAGYVEGMRPLGDSRLLNDRKAFLLSSIKQTVEKLRQLKQEADNFTKSMFGMGGRGGMGGMDRMGGMGGMGGHRGGPRW